MGVESTLTEFNFAGEFEGRGALITCADGGKFVFVVVEREALGDNFQDTFTASERALVVERNLSSFQAIAEEKYRAKRFGYHQIKALDCPLISVDLNDMQRSRLEFSASVVEVSRNAGFVKP